MDADADSTEMEYVNGGITSTASPAPGQNDQVAEWDSRIRRPITNTNESHYFDFDVTVPAGGEEEYLGFIAYGYFELWIFTDRYELWDTTGPTLIGAQSATTAGRHNIGLRAGQGWGVWVDGGQLTLTGGSGSMGLIAAPKARFGTHVNSAETALTLWENLCYLRAYNRGVAGEESIPASGDPVVNVCQFDGPRVVLIDEVYSNSTCTPTSDSLESGDRHDNLEDGNPIEYIELPHGRMHTALVVTQSQDDITYESDGTRTNFVGGDGDPMPGVIYDIHLDAVGAVTTHQREDRTTVVQTPWPPGNGSLDYCGNNNFLAITLQHGGGGQPEGTFANNPVSSNPGIAASTTLTNVDQADESNINTDAEGECCARGIDDSCCGVTAGTTDPSTALMFDHYGGGGSDRSAGIMVSYWGDPFKLDKKYNKEKAPKPEVKHVPDPSAGLSDDQVSKRQRENRCRELTDLEKKEIEKAVEDAADLIWRAYRKLLEVARMESNEATTEAVLSLLGRYLGSGANDRSTAEGVGEVKLVNPNSGTDGMPPIFDSQSLLDFALDFLLEMLRVLELVTPNKDGTNPRINIAASKCDGNAAMADPGAVKVGAESGKRDFPNPQIWVNPFAPNGWSPDTIVHELTHGIMRTDDHMYLGGPSSDPTKDTKKPNGKNITEGERRNNASHWENLIHNLGALK